MRFKQWNMRDPVLWLFYFFCLPQAVGATVEKQGQAYFMVRPLVCIVEQLGQPCQMKAKFSWQLTNNTQATELCVWQDSQQLFCTQSNGLEQQKNWPVELKKSTVFSLRLAQNIIAEQAVEVAGLQPPQYRRRLHSDWSLF